MPTKTERVGAVVVGTGSGCFTHLRALRAAGFDVLALVGRDPAKTAERARQFEVPHALTTLADALALPGVDAVTIATPPHTHAPLAVAAVAAGKHVICEKPFARDAAEGRQMLAAAQAAGVVHLLGTEFRWDVGQATRAEAVASGTIGRPRWRPSSCTSRCWPMPPARSPPGGPTPGAVAAGSEPTARRSSTRSGSRWGVRLGKRVAGPRLRAPDVRRRRLHRALPAPIGSGGRHAEHVGGAAHHRDADHRLGRHRLDRRVGGVGLGGRRRRHPAARDRRRATGHRRGGPAPECCTRPTSA